MLQQFILPAISFGLSAVTIPGPLQAYLLNVTLNYGWRRGLLVILSPLITDGPIILLAVFVLQRIPDWALQGIRIAGGLLLLYIAWGAWQQLRAGATFDAKTPEGNPATGTVREIISRAVAMNVLSPGPWLFWSTITGPLLKEALDVSPLAAIGMLIAFYGTFLGGMGLLVLAFHRIGQIGAGFTRYLLMLTIALLLWYGTRLILVDALDLLIIHRVLAMAGLAFAFAYGLWMRWRTVKHPPLA